MTNLVAITKFLMIENIFYLNEFSNEIQSDNSRGFFNF